MSNFRSVVGVILAGGLAKRMGGGDKCLLPLAGKTLLQRTIDRAQPQVQTLLLNANGSSLRFARTRLPVVADVFQNNLGPLAGIHASLAWMRANHPDIEWLASFASDSPFFPIDLVERLSEAASAGDFQIAVAKYGSRIHPIFALWHASLLDPIEDQLNSGDTPRLQDWVKRQHVTEVDFPHSNYDPFFNINTPQDLYAAEPLVSLVK